MRACGVEIHPAAEIGPGFALIHGVGIVVGHAATLGREVVLHHGVTIGYAGNRPMGNPPSATASASEPARRSLEE